jgi:hypothetical protein
LVLPCLCDASPYPTRHIQTRLSPANDTNDTYDTILAPHLCTHLCTPHSSCGTLIS